MTTAIAVQYRRQKAASTDPDYLERMAREAEKHAAGIRTFEPFEEHVVDTREVLSGPFGRVFP